MGTEVVKSEVTVCIPWRGTPDRMAAFYRVLEFWDRTGFKIAIGNSDSNFDFSLPQARNRAVENANTSKIVVADADTIPDLGAVYRALEDPTGVNWPFTHYRHIEYTDSSDLMSARVVQSYKGSVGGLFVTTTDTYWDLGGQDERFERRWGFEDNAFLLVAQTLSHVKREKGIIFSFDHSADRDLSQANPNRTRWNLYKLAASDPGLMRELIKR